MSENKNITLNGLKSFLKPLIHLINRKAESWDDLSGRPFYETEPMEQIFCAEQTITVEPEYDDSTLGSVEWLIPTMLVEGKEYVVIWNGERYTCIARNDGRDDIYIGNQAMSSFDFQETIVSNEPFFIATYDEGNIWSIVFADIGVSTFKIVTMETSIVKIDEKFLPKMSSVGKEGRGAHAEIFNDYEDNVASGDYAHAEGSRTEATSSYSHAEGYRTIAMGVSSHAEGNRTEASGTFSHAEGEESIASGLDSHAEGYGVVAYSDYQHAQGRGNIADEEQKYAHIVGNGWPWERSNAHTIDWNGVGWFAGDVKVGGTGQDDASAKTLTTAEYVDEKVGALKYDVEESINMPKAEFPLIDQVNGYTYIVSMRNGELVSRCSAKSISVTTMPTKTEYVAGEIFDPTGMVVTATAHDGSTVEIINYTYSTIPLGEGNNTVQIAYTEYGTTCVTTVVVNAAAFDAATALVDFNYTDNGNGTYTITGWKNTLNGASSTEMVIPNNAKIIV